MSRFPDTLTVHYLDVSPPSFGPRQCTSLCIVYYEVLRSEHRHWIQRQPALLVMGGMVKAGNLSDSVLVRESSVHTYMQGHAPLINLGNDASPATPPGPSISHENMKT